MNLKIVAVQAALQRSLRLVQGFAERSCSEHPPLRHEQIEITIAVVVEQRDAWRNDLGKLKPAGHAVEMDEVEA